MRAYGLGIWDLKFLQTAQMLYCYIYQLERVDRNAGRVGEPIRLAPLSVRANTLTHTHTHSCTPIGLYVRVSHIFLAIL